MIALTPREREVADLVAEGLTDREIACHLGISERTVNTHVSRILAAYGVPDRRGVIRARMEERFRVAGVAG